MATFVNLTEYNLRRLINQLSESTTVYFYDLLGYGLSEMTSGDATALRAITLNGLRVDRLVLIHPVALSPWGSPFFRHVRQHEDAFAGVPDYIHEVIEERPDELVSYIETFLGAM